jgi:hypothetical protein
MGTRKTDRVVNAITGRVERLAQMDMANMTQP